MPVERKKAIAKAKVAEKLGGNTQAYIRACQLIDLFFEANIPYEYWFLKMDQFKGPKIFKDRVSEYMENIAAFYTAGHSLCFSGSQGVGKTMSSTCILKQALKEGYSAYYINASDVVAELTTTGKGLRNTLRQADFLVIDEVDSRFFPSDSQKELFSSIYESLFRFRAHNQMPTILCTNENNGLEKVFYGQSVHSISSLHAQYLQYLPVAGKDFRYGG